MRTYACGSMISARLHKVRRTKSFRHPVNNPQPDGTSIEALQSIAAGPGKSLVQVGRGYECVEALSTAFYKAREPLQAR